MKVTKNTILVYNDEEGNVSVVRPGKHAIGMNIKKYIKKCVPSGECIHTENYSPPSSRVFRNSWKLKNEKIYACPIRSRQLIRATRDNELKRLDTEHASVLFSGDKNRLEELLSKKENLKNIPSNYEIDSTEDIKTLEECYKKEFGEKGSVPRWFKFEEGT